MRLNAQATTSAMVDRWTSPLTAPIDNTWRGPLALNYPSSRSRVVNWSNVDVFRAIPAQLCRRLVFLLTAASCSLLNPRDSQAAGCHVWDRPVLASKLSWDRELAVDLGVAAPLQAPPVLAHPPCNGEVPRLLEPAGISWFAHTHQHVGPDGASLFHSLPVHFPSEHSPPPSIRLDRPPRPVESCVTIAPAA
jgi:hypothetical protein